MQGLVKRSSAGLCDSCSVECERKNVAYRALCALCRYVGVAYCESFVCPGISCKAVISFDVYCGAVDYKRILKINACAGCRLNVESSVALDNRRFIVQIHSGRLCRNTVLADYVDCKPVYCVVVNATFVILGRNCCVFKEERFCLGIILHSSAYARDFA